MFSGRVCRTGIGEPVTAETTYYRHPTGAAGFFDTRGIEFGESRDRVLAWLAAEVQTRREGPVDEQMHIAWYCLRAGDRRFDKAQEQFIRSLADLGLPVVLVRTQVPRSPHGAIDAKALKLAEHLRSLDLPIEVGQPIFTAAEDDAYSGTTPFGLDHLLAITAEVVPPAVRPAVAATQRVNTHVKRTRAAQATHLAAAAAGVAALTPIPLADVAVLVPIQTAMVARISAAYGLPLGVKQITGLVTPIVLGGGAAKAGAYIARSLVKLVPGVDWIVGPVNAGVSAALTEAIGWAWVAVCEFLLANDPSGQHTPDTSELKHRFRDQCGARTPSPHTKSPSPGPPNLTVS